ncbi:hypothetical protein Lser_V15G36479 [Lactuca serriola]
MSAKIVKWSPPQPKRRPSAVFHCLYTVTPPLPSSIIYTKQHTPVLSTASPNRRETHISTNRNLLLASIPKSFLICIMVFHEMPSRIVIYIWPLLSSYQLIGSEDGGIQFTEVQPVSEGQNRPVAVRSLHVGLSNTTAAMKSSTTAPPVFLINCLPLSSRLKGVEIDKRLATGRHPRQTPTPAMRQGERQPSLASGVTRRERRPWTILIGWSVFGRSASFLTQFNC